MNKKLNQKLIWTVLKISMALLILLISTATVGCNGQDLTNEQDITNAKDITIEKGYVYASPYTKPDGSCTVWVEIEDGTRYKVLVSEEQCQEISSGQTLRIEGEEVVDGVIQATSVEVVEDEDEVE